MTDLSRYVRLDSEKKSLLVSDYGGQLAELPTDFFDPYSDIVELKLEARGLKSLPASFDKLTNLTHLIIRYTKLKQLPEAVGSMPLELFLLAENNLMDWDKEAEKLSRGGKLTFMELNGYKGNVFPKKLGLLTTLEELRLISFTKNTTDMIPDIIETLGQLPRLKKLGIAWAHGEDTYPRFFKEEYLPIVDRLEEVDSWDWSSRPENSIPLTMGLTKKVNLSHTHGSVVSAFRAKVEGKGYNPFQLQLLFGLWVGNFIALNDWLPDSLAEAIASGEKVKLHLLDKLKGESLTSINKKLEKYGIKAESKVDDLKAIIVVGAATSFDDAEPLIQKGHRVISVDQLQKSLIQSGDFWLLEEENGAVNEQLLRLLASNEEKSYELAFQMIGTGGANKVIQTALAAIMLTHPDKNIAKQATKLYEKFGSAAFRIHVKEKKVQLRTGGNVERKLMPVLGHPDIEWLIFKLMYQCIAGANDNVHSVSGKVFTLKTANLKLPEEMLYFPGISTLVLDDCEGLDMERLIDVVKRMPGCKRLQLNGAHVAIPARIGELVHLEELEIAYNTFDDPSGLQSLKALKVLNVEGIKIKEWDWLSGLKNLTVLNINNNGLKALPEEVFGLSALTRLEAKQNLFTTVPERLKELPLLQHLDLSNNKIDSFPYFLAGAPALRELLLRSNKIAVVSEEELFAGLDKPIAWEKLNLGRNKLEELRFKPGMINLRELDISHNQITVLDEALFTASLHAFYANNNKISELPMVLGKTSNFDYFWIHENQLTELPDFMARARIQNADFSKNQIAFIHPDFDAYGKENYGRLYWKMGDNPLKRVEIGGMYIR